MCVAPFTGAWIETAQHLARLMAGRVAPFTGAWIETINELTQYFDLLSLPSRERGLKRKAQNPGHTRHQVAPFTGAWIETGDDRRQGIG